jgi:hypothetical protein
MLSERNYYERENQDLSEKASVCNIFAVALSLFHP